MSVGWGRNGLKGKRVHSSPTPGFSIGTEKYNFGPGLGDIVQFFDENAQANVN